MGDESKQWVAVTVLIFREGRMLSMRRSSTQTAGAGLWEGVSGRVRAGEDPIATARREVLEETRLGVDVLARPLTAYAALRDGEPMTVIVFAADHRHGEVVLSDEHDDFRWCEASDLTKVGVPVQLADAARAVWPKLE